jgi:GNAT superfamily N-acetyltransferase
MEPVIIRRATLNDLATLLSFEQQIIKAERPFDVTLQDGHINYYDLAHMITAANVEVMVAEFNNEIVGSGYARIKDSEIYLKHRKHGYLGLMYVVPEHRRKGVNQKIIEALKQWCAAQDVYELRLEVYNDNLPAIKAYEKVGFAKLMIEMRLDSGKD